MNWLEIEKILNNFWIDYKILNKSDYFKKNHLNFFDEENNFSTEIIQNDKLKNKILIENFNEEKEKILDIYKELTKKLWLKELNYQKRILVEILFSYLIWKYKVVLNNLIVWGWKSIIWLVFLKYFLNKWFNVFLITKDNKFIWTYLKYFKKLWIKFDNYLNWEKISIEYLFDEENDWKVFIFSYTEKLFELIKFKWNLSNKFFVFEDVEWISGNWDLMYSNSELIYVLRNSLSLINNYVWLWKLSNYKLILSSSKSELKYKNEFNWQQINWFLKINKDIYDIHLYTWIWKLFLDDFYTEIKKIKEREWITNILHTNIKYILDAWLKELFEKIWINVDMDFFYNEFSIFSKDFSSIEHKFLKLNNFFDKILLWISSNFDKKEYYDVEYEFEELINSFFSDNCLINYLILKILIEEKLKTGWWRQWFINFLNLIFWNVFLKRNENFWEIRNLIKSFYFQKIKFIDQDFLEEKLFINKYPFWLIKLFLFESDSIKYFKIYWIFKYLKEKLFLTDKKIYNLYDFILFLILFIQFFWFNSFLTSFKYHFNLVFEKFIKIKKTDKKDFIKYIDEILEILNKKESKVLNFFWNFSEKKKWLIWWEIIEIKEDDKIISEINDLIDIINKFFWYNVFSFEKYNKLFENNKNKEIDYFNEKFYNDSLLNKTIDNKKNENVDSKQTKKLFWSYLKIKTNFYLQLFFNIFSAKKNEIELKRINNILLVWESWYKIAVNEILILSDLIKRIKLILKIFKFMLNEDIYISKFYNQENPILLWLKEIKNNNLEIINELIQKWIYTKKKLNINLSDFLYIRKDFESFFTKNLISEQYLINFFKQLIKKIQKKYWINLKNIEKELNNSERKIDNLINMFIIISFILDNLNKLKNKKIFFSLDLDNEELLSIISEINMILRKLNVKDFFVISIEDYLNNKDKFKNKNWIIFWQFNESKWFEITEINDIYLFVNSNKFNIKNAIQLIWRIDRIESEKVKNLNEIFEKINKKNINIILLTKKLDENINENNWEKQRKNLNSIKEQLKIELKEQWKLHNISWRIERQKLNLNQINKENFEVLENIQKTTQWLKENLSLEILNKLFEKNNFENKDYLNKFNKILKIKINSILKEIEVMWTYKWVNKKMKEEINALLNLIDLILNKLK